MTNENMGRPKANSAEEFAEKPLQNPSVALTFSPEVPEIELREPTHMEVFWAWERLRLIFNLLLFAWVWAIFWKCETSILAGIFFIPHAFLANVCFCAGPVCEGYATAVGVPRSFSRLMLFWCGFLLTATLAYSTVPDELRHMFK